MKLGILSDTHITSNFKKNQITTLFIQLKRAFKDVDKIIHAGDVCEQFFLNELEKIAPTQCVQGKCDNIDNLEIFVNFSVNRYNIGVIHELPEDLEGFMKKYELHIIICGKTHIPIIKGTPFNTLILNPGSPTKPKPPPPKPGFFKPVARNTVITLNIDKKDIMSSFIVSLGTS